MTTTTDLADFLAVTADEVAAIIEADKTGTDYWGVESELTDEGIEAIVDQLIAAGHTCELVDAASGLAFGPASAAAVRASATEPTGSGDITVDADGNPLDGSSWDAGNGQRTVYVRCR